MPNCTEVDELFQRNAYRVTWANFQQGPTELCRFVTQLLGTCDGAVFFDVGANEGTAGMLGSDLRTVCPLNASFKAYFFEPSHWFAVLANNTASDPRNTAFHYAVSDTEGEVDLYRPQELVNVSHFQSTTLIPPNFVSWVKVGKSRRVTLDTMITKLVPPGKDITVLKVDVEGHELHVFRGALRALLARRLPVITYECHGDETNWPYPGGR